MCAYVATTTLSKFVETVRVHGGFTEPHAWESLVTGTSRGCRASGSQDDRSHCLPGDRPTAGPGREGAAAHPPSRPGAYGPDSTGPRPADVPQEPDTEV